MFSHQFTSPPNLPPPCPPSHHPPGPTAVHKYCSDSDHRLRNDQANPNHFQSMTQSMSSITKSFWIVCLLAKMTCHSGKQKSCCRRERAFGEPTRWGPGGYTLSRTSDTWKSGLIMGVTAGWHNWLQSGMFGCSI